MKIYKCGVDLSLEMKETNLPQHMVALWALGQEGFLIQMGDKTLGVDLYLSNSIYESVGDPWVRKFPPLLKPEELPDLDIVLCTHHHEDHMDVATLKPLQHRKTTRYVISRSHKARLQSWGFAADQIIGMNHLEKRTVNGLEVKALAAMHDTFEQDTEGNHLYLGYIIKYNGITIYHAGDTMGFPELVEWLREENIDIALIPINGRDFTRTSAGITGNCNYREAADLAVEAGADLIIPMHFGMFPHNDENPAYFVDYVYSTYPGQKFHMMSPGERFVYMK
jgi:L-ascorbate 6-phosphate lactonase